MALSFKYLICTQPRLNVLFLNTYFYCILIEACFLGPQLHNNIRLIMLSLFALLYVHVYLCMHIACIFTVYTHFTVIGTGDESSPTLYSRTQGPL